MKHLYLTAIIILLSFNIVLNAKEVPLSVAKSTAEQYISLQLGTYLKSTNIELNYCGNIFSARLSKNNLKSASDTIEPLYIFNIENDKGYIIIAGDDASIPVLGYSTKGSINSETTPNNVMKWLEGYRKQIQYIQENNIEQTEEIKDLWRNSYSNLKSANDVSPLIQTQWNQAPYVNAMCPYDYDYNENTVTGCPATAMSQIMRFWEYPSSGTGFHSYSHSKYGTLSANFGTTTYDWASMPNTINSTNNSVATLMYHCGVAVEMEYNVSAEGGSGSYVIIDAYNRYPETQTVEYALPTYFGYDNTIQGLERANYSDDEWISIIKAELDAGRPVQYAGYGQGGHTWVCDGYQNGTYFHMNWGWGGYYDGYFLLDALNPGSGGIGSGAGTYNSGQQALIGIQPRDGSGGGGGGSSTDEDIILYSDITLSANPVQYGSEFSANVDILNNTSTDFSGEFCSAIFDYDNVFIDFVEVITGIDLPAGYHYTNGITFTKESSLSLLPGNYYVCFFMRTSTSNEWTLITTQSGDFYSDLQVTYENDISLYSDISVNTEDIISGGSLSVDVSIGNYSYSDNFSGLFNLSIYEMDGEGNFVAEVEELDNVSLDSRTYNTYTFTTNALDAEPGTYLLALTHQPDGGSYQLSGSTTDYFNPIKIIVQQAPLTGDIYENNNDINNAYQLNTFYSNNTSNQDTEGANFHVGNDWDYYSIQLETGYNYEISARLHDAYNNGTSNNYTVDAMFLYSFDGNKWSDSYDDILPGNITTQGGKTLYFVVSPFFLGETGNYLLETTVTRTSNSSTDIQITTENNIKIYPNPAEDFINITSDNQTITSVALYNIDGRLLERNKPNSNKILLNIGEYPGGVYFIEIKSDENVIKKKIIKK